MSKETITEQCHFPSTEKAFRSAEGLQQPGPDAVAFTLTTGRKVRDAGMNLGFTKPADNSASLLYQ